MDRFKIIKNPDMEPCFAPEEKIEPLTTKVPVGFSSFRGNSDTDYVGIQGVTGTLGFYGGYTGTHGYSGYTGTHGYSGYTGTHGYTGFQGSTGARLDFRGLSVFQNIISKCKSLIAHIRKFRQGLTWKIN